ncbi:MAG TPA: serine/threonine-protein kinase [Polyangiaceae bacterium]|nr:serine/threonine-protein kinase [Polyangiaceae bacterium]
MPATTFRPPEPGQILAGKYRVERVLGQGGMGMVIAAHHLQLDERVALKFLLPEASINGEAVKRFVREARAAVKIKSDHVARVSDVATLDDGTPYLVMEYLEGADLSSELERRGPLAVDEAVELLLQACEAIAEAHSLGIVHRDLKPANLFLTRRAGGAPWVKVLDFGISKLSRGPDVGMTSTTAVMGSPLYMSPEQIRATREVDARADLWALGVILYELLCGRLPFRGDTLPQLSVNIAVEPPEPFPALVGVPAALELVVFRCLEKDRERRYNNVAEFAYALAPFATRRAAPSIERIAAVLSVGGVVPQPSGVPFGATQTANSLRHGFEAKPEHQVGTQSHLTGSAFGGTGVGRAQTADEGPTRRKMWVVVLALGAVAALVLVLVVRSNLSSPAAAPSVAPATAQATPSSLSAAQPVEPANVTPPKPAVQPAPVAAAPSEPATPEPSAAPSASAAAAAPARTAPNRGRKAGAAHVSTPAPVEPPRPAPTPAAPAAQEPRPTPPPSPADVFNNRTF